MYNLRIYNVRFETTLTSLKSEKHVIIVSLTINLFSPHLSIRYAWCIPCRKGVLLKPQAFVSLRKHPVTPTGLRGPRRHSMRSAHPSVASPLCIPCSSLAYPLLKVGGKVGWVIPLCTGLERRGHHRQRGVGGHRR